MEETTRKSNNIRLVAFLLVGVAAFYVFISSAMEGGAYFLTVDEAHAADVRPDKRIRVKGKVVVGPTRTQQEQRSIAFPSKAAERKL